jgi:hypothetical protein
MKSEIGYLNFDFLIHHEKTEIKNAITNSHF